MISNRHEHNKHQYKIIYTYKLQDKSSHFEKYDHKFLHAKKLPSEDRGKKL